MASRRCFQSLVKANRRSKLTSIIHRRTLKQVTQANCHEKVILLKEKENRWEEEHSSFNGSSIGIGFAGLTSAILGLYIYKHETVEAKQEKNDEPQVSRREQRFNEFASYEYLGQIVMSPQDFIESITENKPKLTRRGKIRLTERDLERIERNTPLINKGSNTFFRDRHHEGVITYSEYIFLVTILTKSNTGLQTALKMMDVNGDRVISSEEFQLIVKMINKSASKSAKTRNSDETPEQNEEIEKEEELLTTLMIHLFGKQGNDNVSFDRFFKFMDDLQSEVLELEFHEYSKSMKTISEVDFAKILLRSTKLSEIEYSDYLERMKRRLELKDHPKGITLEQFKAFHTFLSNIEDFVIAVNMTNVMNQSVDKELFTRAIKVTTGKDIDPYVTDVVFSLFDQDGDGELSQQEFIGIMKDRLKRGFGKFPNTYGFAGFKHCLKKEMSK